MEIGRRIFTLRKQLGINQTAFGKQIGVTRSAVCNYENCSRSVGEQVILAICREFNVSEEWLRTGEGEMFVPAPSKVLDALAAEYDLSRNEYALIGKFLELKPEARRAVIEYMTGIVSMFKADDSPVDPVFMAMPSVGRAEADERERTQPDIAAELAELKRQNQELAAKVAAMEEEGAALGLTDVFSTLPSVSARKFSPRVKK